MDTICRHPQDTNTSRGNFYAEKISNPMDSEKHTYRDQWDQDSPSQDTCKRLWSQENREETGSNQQPENTYRDG